MNFRKIGPKAVRGFVVAAVSLTLAACGINSVPTAEEEALAKWADVESSYQRRADLIPNLVNTVKAAAASENEILTGVMEARSKATAIQLSGDDLNNPEKLAAFDEAQGELGSMLSRLMMVQERYPVLKSQDGFLALQDQLEGTENRIDRARTKYNEAVRAYNTTIRTFPDTIGANIIHGAERMEGFKAKPGADVAPEANFE